MGIEVFNRYENKYAVPEEIFLKLQNEILNYMELDEHNKNGKNYAICNIYYDTEDNYFIQTSLQKPKYKEKLRVRSYNVPTLDDFVYVEIKKKFNGLVNKRRTKMKLKEAYSFLETGMVEIKEYMNEQVIREISYILKREKLLPKAYLSYERVAYFDRNDKDLRISFDKNILSRRKNLKLELGDFGEELLDGDETLMEIKTRKAFPIWLTRLISKYKIYPTSFSKYGFEYQQNILLGGTDHVAVNF